MQIGKKNPKYCVSDLFKMQNALPLSKFPRTRTPFQNTCKQTHLFSKVILWLPEEKNQE